MFSDKDFLQSLRKISNAKKTHNRLYQFAPLDLVEGDGITHSLWWRGVGRTSKYVRHGHRYFGLWGEPNYVPNYQWNYIRKFLKRYKQTTGSWCVNCRRIMDGRKSVLLNRPNNKFDLKEDSWQDKVLHDIILVFPIYYKCCVFFKPAAKTEFHLQTGMSAPGPTLTVTVKVSFYYSPLQKELTSGLESLTSFNAIRPKLPGLHLWLLTVSSALSILNYIPVCWHLYKLCISLFENLLPRFNVTLEVFFKGT